MNLMLPFAFIALLTAMPWMVTFWFTLSCVPHESPAPRPVLLWLPVRLLKMGPETHMPPLHCGVCCGQTLPHIPQFIASVCTLVHIMLQTFWPVAQHKPSMHCS